LEKKPVVKQKPWTRALQVACEDEPAADIMLLKIRQSQSRYRQRRPPSWKM